MYWFQKSFWPFLLDYSRQRTSIVALPRFLPSFTPTGLCFDSLMIGMHASCCALSIRRFSTKNISIDILLGLALTRLSSNMSGLLHVLKTGQAGTHLESLSDFILGRLFFLSFSGWSCHRGCRSAYWLGLEAVV
ncbi:hypothetical protein K443DRAFT_208224 [Laccaria amethystina LaAM-08-1]|uniref:Uncharacterized protein n=1 Tax=Laccaria amethystina LaAM-08-1 TaxID=1095629 RepID=A0A0C9XAN3_9AGAR|nr:hypothetical protein K443DRAFT_208224 [Laccaria amethystina LaAM-08-1]